ncbi:MAG: metal ABC transporter substrate-binding protein [Microbacteriaceae bacterium]|nr:metal ABC transporter substrate-binding protein [Microbacteriaceae bacterium]
MRSGKLAGITAAVMLLVGCASGSNVPNPNPSESKPLVVATFTVLASIASEIAGDRVEVRSLIKTGAEVHGYEPTPSDIRSVADADLIIYNGFGLEGWFEKFSQHADAPIARVTEGITEIYIDGYSGSVVNPHVWMSPTDAAKIAENIAKEFIKLDPDGAEYFEKRVSEFSSKLETMRESAIQEIAQLPEDSRALVTCEGAFSYLTRDLGLSEKYLWPVNAEQQVRPRTLAGVIDFVRDSRVKAVFCESTVNDSTMQGVARETGAQFGGILYVDSISEADGPVPTFLQLLEYDISLIVDALASPVA